MAKRLWGTDTLISEFPFMSLNNPVNLMILCRVCTSTATRLLSFQQHRIFQISNFPKYVDFHNYASICSSGVFINHTSVQEEVELLVCCTLQDGGWRFGRPGWLPVCDLSDPSQSLCVFFSFLHPVGVVSSQPIFLISIHMQHRAEVNSSVLSLIKLVRAHVLLNHYFGRFRTQRLTR